MRTMHKMLLILAALQSINIAFTRELNISYFSKGNPLASGKTSSNYLNGYLIDEQQNRILRNDSHFQVSNSLGIKSIEQGKIEYAPYAGTEDVTLDSEQLIYATRDIRFGATNLTYWLGRTMDKVLDLGYLKTKKLNILVYSYCQDMLNAFYHPKENVICVGHLHDSLGREAFDGMASLALDADVIVHEMGHAIFNNIMTLKTGNYISLGNDLLGAMNEGQADFLAHAITGTNYLAPWMMNLAKGYYKKFIPQVYESVKDKKSLRAIKNNLKLSEDYFGEIHDDGSILAGTLRDLADAIGKDQALNLWLETASRINETHNYYNHGLLMLEVDEEKFAGRFNDQINAAFSKHAIFENANADSDDIEVNAQIIDQKDIVETILKELGITDEEQIKLLTENLNGNGKLDKNECVSVELQFKNVSDKKLVGMELFVPNHLVPKKLSNQGQNRNYIGHISPGELFPKKINPMNKRRPWLFICASEDFEGNLDVPIIIQGSFQNLIELKVTL